MGQVNVRVFGSVEDIKEFISAVKQVYRIVLVSPILPNRRPQDIHSHRALLTVAVDSREKKRE